MRALVSALLLLTACEVPGSEGAKCIVSGSWLDPHYACDAPLVCNTAFVRCEVPNTGGVGARCEADAVCALELWCPPGLDSGCAPRIAEGSACPSGVGCQAGLTCAKTDGGTACVR